MLNIIANPIVMKPLIIKSSDVFALLISMTTASFALPACPSSGFFINCFGTYYYLVGPNRGDKYVGEWQNDKRHGKGTYTWTNGEKYVGEWQNDERYGQGTNTWINGEKYEGEWQNDKRHGQGTNSRTSGDKYIGEYKDGYEHGQGTYTYLLRKFGSESGT